MSALLSLALAACFAAPSTAEKAPPPALGVSVSTAPAAADPEHIAALKKQIELDQKEVLKARAALKKAQRGKDEAAKGKALQAWREAKEKLAADRKALRRAIEAREKELAEQRKLKGGFKKTEELR